MSSRYTPRRRTTQIQRRIRLLQEILERVAVELVPQDLLRHVGEVGLLDGLGVHLVLTKCSCERVVHLLSPGVFGTSHDGVKLRMWCLLGVVMCIKRDFCVFV